MYVATLEVDLFSRIGGCDPGQITCHSESVSLSIKWVRNREVMKMKAKRYTVESLACNWNAASVQLMVAIVTEGTWSKVCQTVHSHYFDGGWGTGME